MKNYYFTFIFLLQAVIAQAQFNHKVSGQVVDQEGLPVAVNVVLLSTLDSAIIQGDFFFDGVFELTDINNKEAIIKLSSLEFQDQYVSVSFEEVSGRDLGVIRVTPSSIDLAEVTVSAKRPTIIQRSNGTLELLIENTTLAASNSATEVLSKSPNVLIDESGAISIFGKGNAILYLNNKRIEQIQLSSISPSNIKKIEIIRNPSAKYDAEGAAVIHITTITGQEDGYQVRLNQMVSYSRFAGYDRFTSAHVNYQRGGLSMHANIAWTQGRDRHILHTTRNRNASDVYLQTDLTTDWQHHYKPFANFGMGIQYQLNSKSHTSLEYSGFSEQLRGNQISTNDIEDLIGQYAYRSDVTRNELDGNHTLSYNYQYQMDTIGSHLFVGGQYSTFGSSVDNRIHEERLELSIPSQRALRHQGDLQVNILSLQADVEKVLAGEKSIEFGTKFGQVKNASTVDFSQSSDEGQEIRDPDLSNEFSYDESIAAAYVNFVHSPSKRFTYRMGIRTEYTDYQLDVSQSDKSLIAGQYFNLFPNVAGDLQINDRLQLHVSYASRIVRVPYQRLNPVLYYQDPFTSIQGNPNSIPEKTHAFELGANLSKTSLKVGYNYTLDPFGGGALRGKDDKSYVLIRLNFAKRHEAFASLSRTFETSWLTSNNTLNIRYTDIIDDVFEFQHVAAAPNLYFYSNNRIHVANLFNAELLFYYLGDENEGIYQRRSSWNIGIAIDKAFLDGALTARFLANDLFRSIRAAGDYRIGETDIFFHRHWNTNYIRASISYHFGRLSKVKYKQRAIGESERQRAR